MRDECLDEAQAGAFDLGDRLGVDPSREEYLRFLHDGASNEYF